MDPNTLFKIQNSNIEQDEAMTKYFFNRDPPEKEVYSLLGIDEENAKDVRCCDIIGHLKLYHYINIKNEKVSHVRGIIIDTKQLKIVCKSFPFTFEMTTSIIPKTILNEDDFIKKAVITNCYEGTIVRVFYNKVMVETPTKNENKIQLIEKLEDFDSNSSKLNFGYHISTHRNINGREKRWNKSRSFGELFLECLNVSDEEKFFSCLDKKNCYVFLISHKENSLVCKNKNIVYHLATYDGDMNEINEKINNEYIKYPEILTFNKSSELVKYVNSQNCEIYSGIVLKFESGHMLKIVNDEYYIKRQIIGNEPNQKLRYIKLKQMGMNLNFIIKYLPEYGHVYSQIERDINYLVSHLLNVYKSRYMYRQFKELPVERHIFIKNISLEPKFKDLTVKDSELVRKEIIKKLYELAPHHFCRMLDRFINEVKN